MIKQVEDVPVYVEAGFEWPPVYVKAFVNTVRDRLRPEYPHIDEATDAEVMWFVSELWFPRI